jgi:hypothetical protein
MPDQLYLTGLGRLAYLGLYLPLSLAISIAIYAFLGRRWKNRWSRLSATLPLALLIATAPLWDVVLIGVEATHLCREKAGLKVYRAVEADGFLGGGMELKLAEHGYTYVETGGTLGRKFRDTMKNGKVISEQIDEYASRYWVRGGDIHLVIGKHFSRSSDQVVDRQTGEVLGELVVIGIYPGWFDNIAIAATGTGSGFSPWHCGEEPRPGLTTERGLFDLIFATIHPSKQNMKDRQ